MLAPALELRIPNAASKNANSTAIRLDSWKSVRPFKRIICDDISEFESYMASHAVRSLWGHVRVAELWRHCRAAAADK
jgi:hypothetical protein